MARHGHERHVKRLAAPRIQPVLRKTSTYLKHVGAGKHGREEAVPLLVLLREMLHVAEDGREARQLLATKRVLVDGRPAVDAAAPVGLMDVVTIPSIQLAVRLLVARGKLVAVPVSGEAASVKLCKIRNKRILRGGKIQLNLHDGRNLLIEREEDQFKPGDSLNLSLPNQKLAGFQKLEAGARCYIYRGKHAGKIGTLQEIIEHKGSKASDARLSLEAGGDAITLKNYLFPVGTGFKTTA